MCMRQKRYAWFWTSGLASALKLKTFKAFFLCIHAEHVLSRPSKHHIEICAIQNSSVKHRVERTTQIIKRVFNGKDTAC